MRAGIEGGGVPVALRNVEVVRPRQHHARRRIGEHAFADPLRSRDQPGMMHLPAAPGVDEGRSCRFMADQRGHRVGSTARQTASATAS